MPMSNVFLISFPLRRKRTTGQPSWLSGTSHDASPRATGQRAPHSPPRRQGEGWEERRISQARGQTRPEAPLSWGKKDVRQQEVPRQGPVAKETEEQDSPLSPGGCQSAETTEESSRNAVVNGKADKYNYVFKSFLHRKNFKSKTKR